MTPGPVNRSGQLMRGDEAQMLLDTLRIAQVNTELFCLLKQQFKMVARV